MVIHECAVLHVWSIYKSNKWGCDCIHNTDIILLANLFIPQVTMTLTSIELDVGYSVFNFI